MVSQFLKKWAVTLSHLTLVSSSGLTTQPVFVDLLALSLQLRDLSLVMEADESCSGKSKVLL